MAMISVVLIGMRSIASWRMALMPPGTTGILAVMLGRLAVLYLAYLTMDSSVSSKGSPWMLT